MEKPTPFNPKIQKLKGFTLIELLFCIGISSMLILTVMLTLSLNLKTWRKEYSRVEKFQAVSMVADRISSEIKPAHGIGNSSDCKKLVLNYPAYTLTYDYQAGKVRRIKDENGSYLTVQDLVAGLEFLYPTPEAVIATIKLDQTLLTSETILRGTTCQP